AGSIAGALPTPRAHTHPIDRVSGGIGRVAVTRNAVDFHDSRSILKVRGRFSRFAVDQQTERGSGRSGCGGGGGRSGDGGGGGSSGCAGRSRPSTRDGVTPRMPPSAGPTTPARATGARRDPATSAP